MGSSASIFSELINNSQQKKKYELIKSLLESIIFDILEASVPAIKLVDFEIFKSYTAFPTYLDLLTANGLRSVELVDRNSTFVVYISHAWSRISEHCLDWQGYPQPDTLTNEKYKLCVIGIERAFRAYAEGMKNCAVWMDYCCVPDEANVEYKRLDNLMEVSDCIFTPIFDPDIIDRYKTHKNTKMYVMIENYFDEYPATNWKDGPTAYLNSSWCRLEMYYAATIPLPSTATIANRSMKGKNKDGRTSSASKRNENFSGDFQFHQSNGRRPHLLFGNFEELARRPPYILPSFHNKYNYYQTYFDRYVPSEGYFPPNGQGQADREVVALWTSRLSSIIQSIESQASEALKDGYEGERNAAGEYEGQGSFRYLETGDLYEGHWRRGRKDGYGVYKYANGVVYEGHWRADLKHGTGTIYYPDGDEFRGEFRDGLKSGKGEYRFANKDSLSGRFAKENLHGEAAFDLLSAGGTGFRGTWRQGQRSGQSTVELPCEDKYSLAWKDDKPLWDTLNDAASAAKETDEDSKSILSSEGSKKEKRKDKDRDKKSKRKKKILQL